jgi:hypothetical protein
VISRIDQINTLIFHTGKNRKLGEIEVTNGFSKEIYVSVTSTGGDLNQGGSEDWQTIKANGGSATFGNRNEKRQVIRFTRSESPGEKVETLLGVPGKTTIIF